MTEDGRNSQKKAWKAFQANYDFVFAQSERYCSVCITQQQIAALLAMTEYLKWPTRWVSELGDIDQDKLDAFTSDLETRLMSCCGDDNIPIQYQYTVDGVLQVSYNGGGTWIDAPERDPRVYSPTFPPMPGADGDDKKCVAAAGAAALVKEQVGDQLTDGMSRYTLNALITDWVKTMIETSNPFQALLTVIANQIFALVISVLRPALTDDVYEKFECALYCKMASDASFNTAQWTAVRDKITSSISGIAGVFLEHLVFLLGEKGLTNLVRAGGAATGDCSDCECASCASKWHSAFGTIIETGDGYVIVQANHDVGSGIWYSTISTEDVNNCCSITGRETISGTISDDLTFYQVCGSTDLVSGFITGQCVHIVYSDSNAAFTVKYTFEDC